MEPVTHLLELFYNQVIAVISYPVDRYSRIFVLYLFSSLAFSYLVYRVKGNMPAIGQPPGKQEQGFINFLFPSYIWRERTAWLDVRYFFFHQLIRYSIYGTFLLAVSQWALRVFAPENSLFSLQSTAVDNVYIISLFLIVNVLLIDFISYAIHAAQHRVPMLWEFHKVHHSAEVMHPLTNYREHPFDNLLYAVGTGLPLGLVAAVFYGIFGRVPETITIIGVGVFTFMFNFLAYNLRHSHIWLKWPGVLSVLFGSPAHHQIHHSKHPDHVDKNFAFMFPVWDWIFGTYCMPVSSKDVDFGLVNPDPELDSVLRLYYVPVRRVINRLFRSEETAIKDSGTPGL